MYHDVAIEDRCPVCWRPAAAAGRPWLLRSRHATSLGEVDYCIGPCGCLVVLLDGVLIKTATPARRRARPAQS